VSSRVSVQRSLFGISLVLYVASCGSPPSHGTGAGGAGGGPAAGVAGTGAAGTIAGGAGSGGAGTGAAGIGAGGGTAGASAGEAGVTGAGGGTAGVAPTSDGAAGTATTDAGSVSDGPSSDGPAAAGCSAPGAICWDFESGALPTGWTPYRNEFNGTLLVDDTMAHGGKYALHAKDLQGNTEGKDGGPKKTIRFNLPTTFGPTLWGRVFMYTTPAAPMSHAGFFNARYPRPGAAAADVTNIAKLDWYEVASSTMTYVSIYHPPEPPGTPEWVLQSSTPLVIDKWVCVEWLFDAKNGTASEGADPRVWLDGVEIAWSPPFVSPTGAMRPTHEKATTFSVLEAGVYLYQGLSTATNWWLDDLAVSPQRVGCD
jgi:hypothetical protein